MKKILLVEDDPSLSDVVPKYLRSEGFEVAVSSTIAEARRALDAAPDLVILDWMLPDGQGIDLLRELRARGTRVPVILLTARVELVDKVLGLETGANDYVTKPFEPRELVARIRVQLRSAPGSAAPPQELRAGTIRIDLDSRLAFSGGSEVELTRMEFQLLRLLCENPNKVFSREELLNKVWGMNSFPTTRTVDTHILQLRQKFGEEAFETVRGVGYRLKI